MKYVTNESYLHKSAKEVVAGWLRSLQTPSGYICLDPICSRTNRHDGMFGIYLEYPIGTKGEGLDEVWDEHGRFGASNEERISTVGFCPTVEHLTSNGVKVACVIDIAVLHKGRVGHAIEIVHRHPTPPWKLDFLAKHEIKVFEVCATKVLRCVKRPVSLPLWTPTQRTLDEREDYWLDQMMSAAG